MKAIILFHGIVMVIHKAKEALLSTTVQPGVDLQCFCGAKNSNRGNIYSLINHSMSDKEVTVSQFNFYPENTNNLSYFIVLNHNV